ncbi:methyltransferase domain-containing protein [Streptomyces sp. NPDC096094]|uniref:methyltransferase domain-containing protein n=1 Tax=Streptomyces sp. NPDC096094 TaxID=3366073 RepID=UPI0038122BD6
MTLVADPRQAEARNGPVGAHWAGHQDRYDAMLAGVGDALFGAAAVVPGDRVPDVGRGAGATTRIVARIAAHGHAVGVDISAPLLERACASTAAEGLANAAYVCAGAQVHAFPAAGNDVVVSRGGATVVPVGVGTVRGRDVPDAAEFLLSRVPGGALPASRLAGLEEVLRPFGTGTGTGVRMRDGVRLVTAVRP